MLHVQFIQLVLQQTVDSFLCSVIIRAVADFTRASTYAFSLQNWYGYRLTSLSFLMTNGSIENLLAEIQQWLTPTDPWPKLETSLQSRSAGTGRWYLQSAQHEKWKIGASSFIWLHGSVGCGKTILSASIMEDVQHYCDNDPTKSLAIFFFDFQDARKQGATDMIKSLISQLIGACVSVPEAVESLYVACKELGRGASKKQLLQALKSILEMLSDTFVIVDALDECTTWNLLSDFLTEIQSWDKITLRALVTSRKEVKIDEALDQIVPPSSRICIESHLADVDIETYVQQRLVEDGLFKRWREDLELCNEIKSVLTRKARGMYSSPDFVQMS